MVMTASWELTHLLVHMLFVANCFDGTKKVNEGNRHNGEKPRSSCV